MSFIDESSTPGQSPHASSHSRLYDAGEGVAGTRQFLSDKDSLPDDPHCAETIQILPTVSLNQPTHDEDLVPRESNNAVSIDSLLCDVSVGHESPSHSHQGSLLSPIGSQQPGSLYVSSTQATIINARQAELLHYFKSAVGWPWVKSQFQLCKCMHTNGTSLT